MGVHILANKNDDSAALYCSTTDTAFGPLIYADAGCAYDVADAFIRWLPRDARDYTQPELSSRYGEFRNRFGDDDCGWNMDEIHASMEAFRA